MEATLTQGYEADFKTKEKDNWATSEVTWRLILFLIVKEIDILYDPAFYDGKCKIIFESFGCRMIHERRDAHDPDTMEWAKRLGVTKLVSK